MDSWYRRLVGTESSCHICCNRGEFPFFLMLYLGNRTILVNIMYYVRNMLDPKIASTTQLCNQEEYLLFGGSGSFISYQTDLIITCLLCTMVTSNSIWTVRFKTDGWDGPVLSVLLERSRTPLSSRGTVGGVIYVKPQLHLNLKRKTKRNKKNPFKKARFHLSSLHSSFSAILSVSHKTETTFIFSSLFPTSISYIAHSLLERTPNQLESGPDLTKTRIRPPMEISGLFLFSALLLFSSASATDSNSNLLFSLFELHCLIYRMRRDSSI